MLECTKSHAQIFRVVSCTWRGIIARVPHANIISSSSSCRGNSTIITVADETSISATLVVRNRWFTNYMTQILINKFFHPSRAKLTHSTKLQHSLGHLIWIIINNFILLMRFNLCYIRCIIYIIVTFVIINTNAFVLRWNLYCECGVLTFFSTLRFIIAFFI